MLEPVSVHIEIPSPPETVWRYLTVDELVGRWFADATGLQASGARAGDHTDHASPRSVRFEFGDGDYFVAEVTDWRETCALGLTWRFMGIGPTYEIRIELATCAIGTRVTVSDRGAISEEEARSLREGWIDFVTRLENAISTGRVTRYQWSETINATALVGQDAARVIASLSEQPWWAARFPGAELSVSRIPGGVAAEFRDPAWRGTSTRAEIAIERHTGMAMLQLRHDGWARLPIEIRLAERRRFAARWADCLAQLEASAAS